MKRLRDRMREDLALRGMSVATSVCRCVSPWCLHEEEGAHAQQAREWRSAYDGHRLPECVEAKRAALRGG